MAKRAIRSLVLALVVPMSLTAAVILLFGSGRKYRARALTKPSWLPPLLLVHVAALGSSLAMGLAAWLVWAERGFLGHPDALPLYIAQLSLSLIWDPLVLRIGAAHLGLVFCLLHFGTLVACHRKFLAVHPVAGDLVMPCLAWVAFLTFTNFKLIFT
ncbi:translocator protein homolog [Diospyros lotus]|uniref:translocator protein homolog n=1 Tax=Diospyros lotus TaxID=55363 RepID=UPI002254E5FF|nr:translocator protein homolog [Diospyros lotus]